MVIRRASCRRVAHHHGDGPRRAAPYRVVGPHRKLRPGRIAGRGLDRRRDRRGNSAEEAHRRFFLGRVGRRGPAQVDKPWPQAPLTLVQPEACPGNRSRRPRDRQLRYTRRRRREHIDVAMTWGSFSKTTNESIAALYHRIGRLLVTACWRRGRRNRRVSGRRARAAGSGVIRRPWRQPILPGARIVVGAVDKPGPALPANRLPGAGGLPGSSSRIGPPRAPRGKIRPRGRRW
jgi:hypothetical protein